MFYNFFYSLINSIIIGNNKFFRRVKLQTQLYFYKPLMDKHKKELSFVEDYYDRTKEQFNDIEKEVSAYTNNLYKEYPATPETDPASIAEWAQEQGIEMYETLSLMKSNHLLMTIAMLYHIWEQQLSKFTIQEMEHYLKFDKKVLSFEEIKKIFELHGINIIDTESWKKIRELKLLANTIKHGEGHSAEKLRDLRPDFFKLDIIDETDTLDLHSSILMDVYSLQVNESDLKNYIKATMYFWDEMPERAYSNTDQLIEIL